jgi:hypothetical protein
MHFIRYRSPPVPCSRQFNFPNTPLLPPCPILQHQTTGTLMYNGNVPDAPPMKHIQTLTAKSSPCHLCCFPSGTPISINNKTKSNLPF